MTALTTLPPAPPGTALTAMPSRPGPLLPANMGEAMRLAEIMAQGRLVPAHLQKSPADCLAVILQSIRWQTDPFATAQCTSVISGKLMFEGKLTTAVINTSGRIRGRLHFEYDGVGDERQVTCSGQLVGEPAPVSVTVRLRDAKTGNKIWLSQPDQQLAYHSARVWARRYMPETMLGIYAPEEMPAPDARHEPADGSLPTLAPPAPEPDPSRRTPLLELRTPGGGHVNFPKTGHGIAELLKYVAAAEPGVVLLNLALLDTIAERMPTHAETVAEIRAKAAADLAPAWASEPDQGDDDTDQGDDAGARHAVAQGARPPEMTEAEASNLPE